MSATLSGLDARALWGRSSNHVDPLGTLLGDLSTFREVFCGSDDRKLAIGQEEELRSRIAVVMQRRPIKSRWADSVWELHGVLPDPGGARRLLRRADAVLARWVAEHLGYLWRRRRRRRARLPV